MKKLYIVYLPKKVKESLSDRKILKILKWYSQTTKYTNSIISSPGYMSKTIISIDHYLSSFANHVNSSSSSNNIYFGILNGMNGSNNIKNQGVKILDCHNNTMNKYNFTPIKMKVKPVSDHRKIMCFFKQMNSNKIGEINNISEINSFLNSVIVNAVLIGSSNQSDSTYFDNISNKGEADIFMFIDDCKGALYNSIIESREFEDTVITESVYGKGDSKPEEFLKDILADLLYTNI